MMRIALGFLALFRILDIGVAESPIHGCVRLCLSVCGETVNTKCIDTSTTWMGCSNAPVEFFAQQTHQCPYASHPTWGIEHTPTGADNPFGFLPASWPEDKDYRTCENGETPEIWDGAGTFEDINQCKTYMEQMEKSGMFDSKGIETAEQEEVHLRRLDGKLLRQDWGATTLSVGVAEKHLQNLAVLSFMAYAQGSYFDAIRSWSCKLCSKLPRIQEADIDFAIAKGKYNLLALMIYDANEDTVIISYRGTEKTSIWNWLINLSADPVPFQGGFVHHGFLDAMQELDAKGVQAFLRRYPSSKVVFTGHSLGGAMATLAGRYYTGMAGIPSVKAVVSFGAPRSMLASTKEGAKWLVSLGLNPYKRESINLQMTYPVKLHRVVYNKDPVPHLPPKPIYTHGSTEIFYKSGDRSGHSCDGSGEDPNCSNQFSFFRAAINVGDHGKYQDAVPVIGGSAGPSPPEPKCASGGSRGTDGSCCTNDNCTNGWLYGCSATNDCKCIDGWTGCGVDTSGSGSGSG